ncbi:MAG TPA: hypothetical protein VNB22_08780 [Pyrinomonadaceae bacterium]|nr:hypothetical protein [Pyrinomonadaceae bacterium]
MAEKNEKLLTPDEFKEKVYKNVGLLESLDEAVLKQSLEVGNQGCFGIFVMPFMHGIVRKATKLARKDLKIQELNEKAEELLARKEMKGLLCKQLDATVNLPIDAAYKLTPVLYKLALENDKNVPFDSMLFAIICRNITKRGVHNYCG